MGNHIRENLYDIFKAGVALLLVTFVILIAILQHSSTSYSIHATSGSTCSCGCVQETGECGTTCCTSMSVAPCGCNEPHKTVVEFIMPTSFELFFQLEQALEMSPLPGCEQHILNDILYESLVLETPSPVPIA